MSAASRKIMRFFGKGEFMKRFDYWANAPEGWTSLCIEKDLGDLEDEISYLDSVGIKGTYMKNLKRVDTKGRDLRYPAIMRDITVSRVTIVAPIITVVLTFLLMTLVNHTKLGMAMRACSKDQDTARIMGIKVDKVITMTFVIGCGLAAIGSILYFTDRNTVQPYSGSLPGLKCFVAAVLGGIGSIPGAMVGGFIVGICQIAITAAGYSVFSDAFTFVLLIFILIIRPTGIFGEKATDKV